MLIVISPEKVCSYHADICNQLFEEGLDKLILRLPGQDLEAFAAFIRRILSKYRKHLLVADHHEELCHRFDIGGFYCSNNMIAKKYRQLSDLADMKRLALAVGIHTLDELDSLPNSPTFALLSPLFASLSKPGYEANLNLTQLKEQIRNYPTQIIAMGGVTSQNITHAYRLGYDGGAVIGDIWQSHGNEIYRFRQYKRGKILSVAGLDPSGGAGVLADVKVANNFGVDCCAVIFTNTIQSESCVEDVIPQPLDEILRNIRLNTALEDIRIAKIGLSSSFNDILAVLIEMKQRGVKRIIWDPIIQTTANNFCVLNENTNDLLPEILKRLYLITPNREEAIQLFGSTSTTNLQGVADQYDVHILVKGGHSEEKYYATDTLYLPKRAEPKIFRRGRSGSAKHGTGCMLSSAIMSGLENGLSLEQSIANAQAYVSRAMTKSVDLIARLPINMSDDKARRIERKYHLQYVTNHSDLPYLMSVCQKALEGGLRWIQLRLKNESTEERIRIARAVKVLTGQYDAVLIVDDDVEAVIAADVDGVHLGLNDMDPLEARRLLGTDKIIGLTCNEMKHILRASEVGADYIGVGPYRMTYTKSNLAPILGINGLGKLTAYNQTLSNPIPMVAIGGIKCEDIKELRTVGIKGFAISGEIERAADVSLMTQRLLNEIKK